MSNPLHKNKVIEFIKRYPNTDDFTLTSGNNPLAVKPGDPIPNSNFIPGCTVGLSGTSGNPSNFNSLVDMWVAGGLTRANINPYGLMRLWAAAYRTYFGWVKQVKRPYFNPSTTSIVYEQTVLNPSDYTVKFTSTAGTATVTGESLSGLFKNGTGKFDSSGNLEQLLLPNNSASIGLLTDVYFPSSLISSSDTVDGPFGAIAKLAGGPIKCELIFNEPVDIQAIRIPIANGVTSFNYTTPTLSHPFPWFNPAGYRLRASYDGIAYTSSYTVGLVGGTAGGDYPAKTLSLWNSTNPRYKVTNQNIDALTMVRAIVQDSDVLASGSKQRFSTNPYTAILLNTPTLLSNAYTPGVDLSPITPGFEITDGIKDITLYRSSVAFPARVKVTNTSLASISERRSYSVSTTTDPSISPATVSTLTGKSLVPVAYDQNALYNYNYYDSYYGSLDSFGAEIYDITTISTPRILSSNLKVNPPVSLKNVRALEITSGYQDGTNLRPYLASFVYVLGTTTKTITTLNSDLIQSYTPDFTNSFWTSNSPTSFTLNTLTFTDAIASTAFALTGITATNVEKWKLLPYTLPISSINLENNIKSTSITLTNVPLEFNYTEDYLNNKIIPLPSVADLTAIEAAALARRVDPVVYYYKLQFNLFLSQLIEYCKKTCLKFWKWEGSNLSVSNYLAYTTSVLQVDNLGLFVPRDQNGNPISIGIGTYGIDSGAFDIDSNVGAAQLWFLSGGGPSRVDVDLAVLQKLLDISGITQ